MRFSRKGRKEKEMQMGIIMKALGCAVVIVATGFDRTTNTDMKTKDEVMMNATNDTALSAHCARLFAAAKEADVPTVVEDGTFMPTLYVATERSGIISSVQGKD